MTEPLREWESEAVRRATPRRRIAEEKADVAERRLKRVKDEAAKGNASLDEVEAEILALESARREIPTLPELLAQDSTPEALVAQMAEQGGRVAVFSPEAGPIQIMDGRYSAGTARLEELAQAYDGEELRPRRIGRETRTVRRPALTLAVALQPSALATLRNVRSLRGQGIYGRIAWVMPMSLVGSRVDSSEAPALDAKAADRYARVLHHLLEAQPDTDDDGTPIPVEMTLSSEAAVLKARYHYRVEAAMKPGGEYAGIKDAAGKTVGRAIRIAALLELASRAEDGRPLTGDPISAWAMGSGIRLCEALMTHTLRVYGEMAMDQRTSDLRYLLDRLTELPAETTETDLRAAVRGRSSISDADAVADLINELEERQCVRRRPEIRSGPGRPLSPTLLLHPNLRRGSLHTHTENTENPSEEGAQSNIRDFRYTGVRGQAPANGGKSGVERITSRLGGASRNGRGNSTAEIGPTEHP